VWVGVSATPLNDKGGTLVLATAAPFGTIDPAFHNVVPGFPFMRLSYDTLVTFEPVAGPSGLRLVPDLALQVPLPTDGGRTYSFRVRPGIRYSDGQLLTASDFRRGVERLFQVGSPGADYYGGLVGAQGCLAHPGHCNLSQGVVTDNATGSVVFQLTAPDPEFVYKLTPYAYGAPIPPGVPNHDIGTHPVPGTGPYEITSVTTRGVVFERNPYFREWSHAAQPQGNPDVIVWRYYRSQPQEVTAIERGKADWTFDFITPAQVRSLQVNYPTQLHNDPTFVVDFIPINTHAPPFNNILVRRALNYAIDRGEIARWYGGPSVATPTCQPLIPGLLGYERYCPYTLNPQPDGAWSAPNLALAKRLVAESGTKGELVNVVGATDGEVPLQVPAYIAQVLRSLGYRARLHMVPFESITETERRRFQLEVDGDWGPDYPDPSSYIPQFFACNGGNGNGWYCNPGLDQEMTKATLFELEDPAQASATWTEVDHQITDQAVWVPMVDRRWVEFTSKRLENYQFNPVWGFVPDQAVLH
jgi:peptide/nickel transport system substrate-binding protein